MIVMLLILIVLILLFGAGVVKGWLANILGAVLGLALLIAVVCVIGSLFGENGPIYAVFGVLGLLFLLSIGLKAVEPVESNSIREARERRISARKKGAAPADDFVPSKPLSREEKKAAKRKLRGLE